MTTKAPWAGIVKLQEETSELGVELAKLHAAPDGKHWDNSEKEPLVQRVMNEMADVQAALLFFAETNFSPGQRYDMSVRTINKLAKFIKWHASEGMTGTKHAR